MSKRILIVRLSAIGDVVLCTPVARQLRKQHPDWHLTWLVQRKALGSIANNPWLDEIKVMPDYDARSLLQVWRELRGQYDITIDLQCLAKSAFVTWEINSPLRLGRETARPPARWAHNRHTPVGRGRRYVSQYYLEECEEFGADINDYVPELHPSDEDQATAARLFAEYGLDDGRPVVALIAFVSEPNRMWPAERFAEVGDRLAEEHGAVCIIPGARGEREAAEALAARMRHKPVVLAGETSLGAAAAVLQRCRLAIGGDTGLTHYAFAVGAPLVCLVGPSPTMNGPKSDTAVTLASPCEFRPCKPRHRCRRGEGRPCLVEISVEDVLEAARGLLCGAARR